MGDGCFVPFRFCKYASARSLLPDDVTPRVSQESHIPRPGSMVGLMDSTCTAPRSSNEGWTGPFLVGVAGGTASGKKNMATAIKCRLEATYGASSVGVLDLTCFYKDLNGEELEHVGSYNFDHPDAIDWDRLISVMQALRNGQQVYVPAYDIANNCHATEGITLDGSKLRVVVVEGILLFYTSTARSLFDLRIFTDVASDARLCRRIRRDVHERGRDVAQVLAQYQTQVKPAFEAFCQPTQKYADIILPRGMENRQGLQVILSAVQRNAEMKESRSS